MNLLRPLPADASTVTNTAASTTATRWSPALARAALRTRWRALQRHFNQRAPRERLLLIAAAAALTLMLADALWLGPAIQQFRSAHSQQRQTQTDLQGLRAAAEQLAEQGSRQTRTHQAELAGARQRVREGEAALRQHEDTLVGPDRMIGLLEHLLARHGNVRVRAMRSLGRSDLLAPVGSSDRVDSAIADQPANNPAAPAPVVGSAGAPAQAPRPSLYRHGVELVLEGGYADLLSYLQAMEALPQRVLWGSVSLRVEQHPKSVLTLRVYTISRERHWLEI